MNLAKLNQKQLMTRCAWCHKVISQKNERFGGGTRVSPAAKPLLTAHEGKLIPMPLTTGREIIAIVPTADSEARAAGHDIYFQTCSEECCTAVSNAIRAELPGPNQRPNKAPEPTPVSVTPPATVRQTE